MQVAGLKGSQHDRKKKCIIGVAEWPLRIPQLVVCHRCDFDVFATVYRRCELIEGKFNHGTAPSRQGHKLLEPTCQLHNG